MRRRLLFQTKQSDNFSQLLLKRKNSEGEIVSSFIRAASNTIKRLLIAVLLLLVVRSVFAVNASDNGKILRDTLCDGRIKIRDTRYDGGNRIGDWGWIEYQASDGSWKLIMKIKHWDDNGNKYQYSWGSGVEDKEDKDNGSYYGYDFYWNPEAAGASDLYNTDVKIRFREREQENSGSESIKEYIVHPVKPKVPGSLTVKDNGYTELNVSWSEPSNLSVFEGISGYNECTYQLWEDISQKSYWPGANTSQTITVDPGTKVELSIRAIAGCNSMDDNWGDYSSEVTGGTAAPLVSKPAGLTATSNDCNGNVTLSWDYNGETEPKNFTIIKGTEEITVAGDLRGYTDNIGEYQSKTYKIKAVGDYNTSDPTSEVTGYTLGKPSAPSSFSAYASGTSIHLSWSAASHHTKYVLRRASQSGSAEFEIDKGQASYTDNTVAGCETYQYELYAANECTDDAGLTGIKASNKPSVRIQPYLGSYITSLDASKAYYPDKVVLEWSVQDNNLGLVDNFEVWRRKAGESSYVIIGTVTGQSTYDDKTAIGGVLYEYKVVAKLKCENDNLSSNTRSTVGFRIPYGVINGNISYENGINVKGVDVMAEKEGISAGNSLYFDGGDYITVNNNSKLNPDKFIAVEAWVKPASISGTADIFNKSDGTYGYRLYLNGANAVFEAYINGAKRTVTAQNAVTVNEFTHLAGVYDSTGLKIFVNGLVPTNTRYEIEAQDTAYLSLAGISSGVISMLSGMVGTNYNSFEAFNSELLTNLDTALAESILPLLIPVTKIVNYRPGTFDTTLTGSLGHTSSPLKIGSNFTGNIDEIRIWNLARDEEQVYYDYRRIVGNDAKGIAAYWRCDENFGSYVYDVSKSNGEFNKNNGTLSGPAWSSDIPSSNLLGWMGKTNAKGDYTIPYIPYYGTGENFSLTPRYEQHQFEANQKTVFIGEGASILSEQDFTDISSFKLTGTVSYENTYCGVEGAIVGIDGEPVIKNGKLVYTDQNGEFSISVPVGYHYVYVQKSGHNFLSYKFPPGPESATFDFQEPMNGVNFIDKTKVRIVGRVVGGTIEGDKDPGLGLSVNNIGVAKFKFEAATGCTSYNVETDSLTGEYSIDLPPMAYLIKDFDVYKNPAVSVYFSEFPESDFSLVNDKKSATHTYSGMVGAVIKIDRDNFTATIDVEGIDTTAYIDTVYVLNNAGNRVRFFYGNDAFEYTIDTTSSIVTIYDHVVGSNKTDSAIYNYRYDLIYRTPPQIRIAAADSVHEFTGDQTIYYEDPVSKTLKTFDVLAHPFNYPVFKQFKEYALTIHAEEYYLNQDVCPGINGCNEAILDRVPVDDGIISINNQLAAIVNPDKITMKEGVARYKFRAGQPQVLTDHNFPWRDYSGVFNISVKIDGVSYEWTPIENKDSLNFTYPLSSLHPDDRYFRGYVLGDNPIEGSDFVTDGPQMVDMILRDPPGNGSYSYISQGTTISEEESFSLSHGSSTNVNMHVSLGPKFEAGIGFVQENEVIATLDIGVTKTTTRTEEGGLSHESTITDYWQTSSDPYLPGSESDLFIGSSTNYTVSLADHLSIFPVGYADSSGIPTSGKEAGAAGNKYKVGLNKSILMAPEGSPTGFIYTKNHIESFLIPNLENVRNNIFINDTKYKSNIPVNNELYGSNNDDPRWGKSATTDDMLSTTKKDYDGPSYTFTPSNDDDVDQIRKLNQQIRLWKEALERNEMEKYYSELITNVSYDAGPVYERTIETSVSTSQTSTIEINLTNEFAGALGIYFGGMGGDISTTFTIDRNVGKTTTNTTTKTNTFGYVLYDEDEGDYFSVDIKDPKTGTGPVFSKVGGRTMCPCERASTLDYFVPAKYTVTDSVLSVLDSLQADSIYLKILGWGNKTGKYTIADIEKEFEINSVVKSVIPSGAKFKLPQIKEREFKKRYELLDAFNQIVNLNLPYEASDFYEEMSDSLSTLGDSELKEFKEFMKTDAQEGNIIYLFSEKQRENWTKEYIKYRSYLYNISGSPVKKPDPLEFSTLRREYPVAGITPALVENVPEDNKAYLTLQLGNLSATNESQNYEMKVLEESNPDGAIITIDGTSIQRGYLIGPGQYINKTLSVEMGKPDVYEYDSLQIIFYSACERQLVGLIAGDMDPEAIDTVTFSVHFVPSCTDVEIARPSDDYIINSDDEHLVDGVKQTKVPILLTGYDLNNSIFDKMSFQFKSSADPDWIVPGYFYVAPEKNENGIPGNFTALEWDLSGYPDGEYNIRAKTGCGTTSEGVEIFDLSEVWTGIIDRKPPKVFGSPQPADGILSPDDDVILEFNEKINGEKLTKMENFSIEGILNGTELRHDVSIHFDNDKNKFIRIPEGINLYGKSFTVEFWLKPNRAYAEECILSQSTNVSDALYIGLNNSGYFEFQVGAEKIEAKELNVADILNEWHHFAFVYDGIRGEAIVLKDGVPVTVKSMNTVYDGFGDIYVGKSLAGSPRPFKGNIHELRIWERPRTASKIASNMLLNLSGKETGLVGYWPMDESYGILATDKVHKRNASINAEWEIYPSGYACALDQSPTGVIGMNFSDIAFNEEQNFSIEFWFKSNKGANTCFISNGHGNEDDVTVYYISPEILTQIGRVLPLEDSLETKLDPMLNKIFSDEGLFLAEVSSYLGEQKAGQYKEQILRFAKISPTYWCINTDASGNIQLNNNSKQVKIDADVFDNTWHHFAVVVERIGNTRMYIDGELKLSEPSTEWNGFGAAKLFIGARGLFEQSIADFTFDQYFNGKLDEIRVWNTALKQTQIQRNSTMRMDGDELGLVAYFPFEKYDEIMGVPVISGYLGDIISPRDSVISNGIIAEDTDVPNIRMKRPTSKVDFDFVYKDDQVAFVINEPVAKIENCILDITARNVQDMYKNKMQSPVTWSAFVDMNQVKWDEQQFDLEKRIYEPMSFTATILNNSGEQQNFSVENLPGWLIAEPREGTLQPLTSVEVTFTIDEGTNIGRYSQNIHLHTDFDFDEKLMVNLRVYKDLPDDWKINPAKFEHSMNLIGKVIINDVVSNDKYDKVAAFVNGECRGIADLKYIEEYDMYEVFLDVYSNKVAGEYFELHLWDASTGREYRKVLASDLEKAPEEYENMYQFIDNTIHGSPSHPISLEANSIIIQKIPLASGWNWKSFNLEKDEGVTLTRRLEGYNFSSGDMIKGLTSYSEYTNYWIGTLNYLEPQQMYMFKVRERDTLSVSGIAVSPKETPIPIVEGWNWIGYTPQENIEINSAFGLFQPNHGDLIKSQHAFSMYDELMGWVGTLTYLRPNEGYKYKYIPQGESPKEQILYFPLKGTSLKSASGLDEMETLAVMYDFPDNMPLIAKLEKPALFEKDQGAIYAFIDNQLRGKAYPVDLKNGKHMYFLSIYGDMDNDTIYFDYVDEKGNSYDINETLLLNLSQVKGTVNDPVVLTMDGIEQQQSFAGQQSIVTSFPNPFDKELFIRIEQPVDRPVDLEIFDMVGKSIDRLDGLSGLTVNAKFETSAMKIGVYLLRITIGGVTEYRKIIKEK